MWLLELDVANAALFSLCRRKMPGTGCLHFSAKNHGAIRDEVNCIRVSNGRFSREKAGEILSRFSMKKRCGPQRSSSFPRFGKNIVGQRLADHSKPKSIQRRTRSFCDHSVDPASANRSGAHSPEYEDSPALKSQALRLRSRKQHLNQSKRRCRRGSLGWSPQAPLANLCVAAEPMPRMRAKRPNRAAAPLKEFLLACSGQERLTKCFAFYTPRPICNFPASSAK